MGGGRGRRWHALLVCLAVLAAAGFAAGQVRAANSPLVPLVDTQPEHAFRISLPHGFSNALLTLGADAVFQDRRAGLSSPEIGVRSMPMNRCAGLETILDDLVSQLQQTGATVTKGQDTLAGSPATVIEERSGSGATASLSITDLAVVGRRVWALFVDGSPSQEDVLRALLDAVRPTFAPTEGGQDFPLYAKVARLSKTGQLAVVEDFDWQQGNAFVSIAPRLGAPPVPVGTGGNPVWSPDGAKLAFERGAAGSVAIAVLRADGTGLRVVSGSKTATGPSWSPDGTRLAFSVAGPTSVDVMVVGADGKGPRRLAAGLDPSWSPDGTQIALSSAGLVLVKVAGKGRRVLVDDAAAARPRWSPDGKRIAFFRQRDAFVVDVATGRERKVAAEVTSVAWSPDSQRLAIGREASTTGAIVDLRSGKARAIAFGSSAQVSWAGGDGRIVVAGRPPARASSSSAYGLSPFFAVQVASDSSAPRPVTFSC